MKKYITTILFTFAVTTFSFGQKNVDKILEEGKLLYRLEKASWFGTDVFLKEFPHKINEIGGYLSYLNENSKVINIFFERDNPFSILVRFEFDSLPQSNPVKIDTLDNIASKQEIDLITMRQDAFKKISDNEDRFFTFYKDVSFNLIPLIHNGQKRVFILTGHQVSNVVVIGNDYVLTYDKKNKFVQKEKIHNSIIQYPCKSDDSEDKMSATIHSHILSDYITSTDICTLLLYKDYIEWEKHYVISKKYVSIFDLKTEELFVITKAAWDKINKNK